MTQPQLLGIAMPVSDRVEIYSGVARMAGKLWASLHRAPGSSRTVVVVVHPSSNFLGHYLLAPLAAAGIDAVGLNTRYIGNDSALTLESCVVDVGAAVAHLRGSGYENVVLVGNSGGGGLAALYQSQAESPSIRSTPAGDPPDLTSAELPPVDALVPLMAHPGRAIVLSEWLDPSLLDEADPLLRDPALDMFDARNGPPYPPAFLADYRAAQLDRNRRITAWVRRRLEEVVAATSGQVNDLPFVVHGTTADPRFLDLTIDPSDREQGTMWGPPLQANLMPASLGHHTSLRSWLSQWSLDESNGHGPRHLARTSVPTLVMYGTADQVCFTSHARALFDAIPHERKSFVAVEGGTHYLQAQPGHVERVVDTILSWLTTHGLHR